MTAKNKHTKPAPADPAPAAEGEAVAKAEPAPIDSISVEELEDLKARAAKADENWDKFLRAAAELENYRKRVAREKEELARYHVRTRRVRAAARARQSRARHRRRAKTRRGQCFAPRRHHAGVQPVPPLARRVRPPGSHRQRGSSVRPQAPRGCQPHRVRRASRRPRGRTASTRL